MGRRDDPFKGHGDHPMIDSPAIPQRLLALFHGGKELLFSGDVSPQGLIDEP